MKTRESSIILIARCIVALQSRPVTLAQIQAEVGCSKETPRRMVSRLLEAGLVEFKGWGKRHSTGGSLPAMYGWKS